MDHDNFKKLEIPLFSALNIFYEKTHKLIHSFPKFERYTIGEKIEKTILETLEYIILANSSNKFEKEKLLMRVNAKIELLKVFYRLTLNCNMIKTIEYLEYEKDLQDAGKQIQGWIKYTRNPK